MDSIALCTLLKYHREVEGWPEKVFAYTIEHGVRPESAEEAASVAKLVKDLGFNHRILKLSERTQQMLEHKFPKNLETILRKERSWLWRTVIEEDALEYVLIGHHEDDQYETILQRIAWGSGPVGLAGIPPVNGYFIRPMLAYPKTRLQATCELYNIPWFTDYTNFEPTHALRNSIRHITRNQEDLPMALRKESLIPLAERGRKYREELLDKVNSMLSQCTFERDTFTGGVKVQFPVSMIGGRHQRPGIARFIAVLARIFLSGRVQQFSLRGVPADKVSDAIVETFCKDKLRQQFTVFGLLFQKIPPSDHERYVLYIAPQVPRRDKLEKDSRIVPITVTDNQTAEWKETEFRLPNWWFQPWKIQVSVKEDRGYYFRIIRRLDAETRDYFKVQGLGEWDSTLLDNSKKRSRYYPYGLLLLLCHRENNVEKLDCLPRHGIHLSEGVRIVIPTKFDLTQSEIEYVDMELDPELMKRREEHLKATNEEVEGEQRI